MTEANFKLGNIREVYEIDPTTGEQIKKYLREVFTSAVGENGNALDEKKLSRVVRGAINATKDQGYINGLILEPLPKED